MTLDGEEELLRLARSAVSGARSVVARAYRSRPAIYRRHFGLALAVLIAALAGAAVYFGGDGNAAVQQPRVVARAAAGVPSATRAQPEHLDCASIDETDFERVVACMALEELAGQLTAFNEPVALRLTGKTLEESVRAGLGTIMGVTVNPPRIRKLQQLAKDHGHPPLLVFEDTERGARTILGSPHGLCARARQIGRTVNVTAQRRECGRWICCIERRPVSG